MATCALTRGFQRYDCEAPAGGIQELYVIPFRNVTAITETDNLVTAITSSGTWFGYALSQEVGLLETTDTKSIQNNSLFYDANLSFTLNKMEASASYELELLAIQQVIAIVKTNTGSYFMIGDEFGAHKTGGTNNSSTGTAFGDLQGYNINLFAKQTHDVFEVDASVISGLTINFIS